MILEIMPKQLHTKILIVLFSFLFQYQVDAKVEYLENLKGENIQIGNLLKWVTSEEENNQLFIIERSFDGIDFEKIGKTNGVGNSLEINEYEFLDINVHTQKLFYRLKQVDFDGGFTYTEILQIQSTHPNNFMVNKMSSTMTTNSFEVILEIFQDGEIAYSLQSLKGEQIIDEKLTGIVGYQKIIVDLEFQPEGLYRLNFQMGEEIESLVIQKMSEEKLKNNMASSKKN